MYSYTPNQCRHAHDDLCGCALQKGHSGLHANRNIPSNPRMWPDHHGRIINTQEDWDKHINSLGDEFDETGRKRCTKF